MKCGFWLDLNPRTTLIPWSFYKDGAKPDNDIALVQVPPKEVKDLLKWLYAT